MFTSTIFKSYSLSCKSLGLVRLDTSQPGTCLRALHNALGDYHALPGSRAPAPRQRGQSGHGLKQELLISTGTGKTPGTTSLQANQRWSGGESPGGRSPPPGTAGHCGVTAPSSLCGDRRLGTGSAPRSRRTGIIKPAVDLHRAITAQTPTRSSEKKIGHEHLQELTKTDFVRPNRADKGRAFTRDTKRCIS